jgi:general stress protein 26
MKKEKDFERMLSVMKIADAAILTVVDDKGFPDTRAMLNLFNEKTYPALVDFLNPKDGSFRVYFTTNTSSRKLRLIEKNGKASLYYCRQKDWRGVMLQGEISVINDLETKKRLWQDEWKMYYAQGVTDPDCAVLCFTPRFVRGYDQFTIYEFPLEG